MRSNTTFHPEILFDWPPWVFHVLLEEHRKFCVKVMSCMSDVIIPLDMLSRSQWLWLLLWCLQVPGQLDARLSSPSSSLVSVSLLAPGLGCPHPAQTLDRASYCLQSWDMYSQYCHQTVGWNQSYRVLLPVFSPDAPAPAHYSELTTIHPRCVVPPWPGQPGRSLAPALSAASRLSQLSRKRTAARYRPVSPASVSPAITR